MLTLRVCLLLLFSSTALASGALHTDGTLIRDAQNAVVVLRGVNVAGNAKVPPFMPLADTSLLDPLPKWGVNAIRLLFTWEAYEPMPGQYSDGYLDYIRSVVEAAHARGLYVVVDFHQDAYSRFSLGGCGDGFPAWTLPPDVAAATPDNSADCAGWGIRLEGDALLATTWHELFANVGGARDAYLMMLTRVATALSVEPGVVGYDLLNEPEGDEPTELSPFYEDAAAAVRAGDRDAIVFIEPNVTSAGDASKLLRPTFGNFVYAPHYYDASVSLGDYNGSDEKSEIDAVVAAATPWNAPVVIGEFGAAATVDGVDDYMSALHRQFDDRMMSAVQWAYTPGWTPSKKDGWDGEDFSIVDDQGQLRANFRPRPAVQRVAGSPVGMSLVDGNAPYLIFGWQPDNSGGATQIFAPASYFGGAVGVDATGADCSVAGDLVSCTASGDGAKIRITAASSCGLTGAECILVAWALSRVRRRRCSMRG